MAQSTFPQRRRTRLREYDYASAGRYFITLCTQHRALAVSASSAHDGASVIEERAISLSAIVQWFKTKTTNAYIHGVHDSSWPRFDGRLWQRSFHDRIIRNDREFDLAREYIAANPARWHEDAENPYRS